MLLRTADGQNIRLISTGIKAAIVDDCRFIYFSRNTKPVVDKSEDAAMKGNQYISALNYDWLSPYYDMVVAATSREREFKTALVEQAQIRSGHRILDLACGTGTLAILIKNSQPSASVTGIDGDPKILGIARKKSLDAGAEIQFDKGLSYDMPYQNESFDRVTSSLFFHHLTRENKLKTMSEVYRVLKPDGEFHIADWGLPANPLMKLSSYFVQMLDGFETTADSFGGRLPDLLTRSNFERVEETRSFNTLLGTIRLHSCGKTF